jgi:hypothetical protein
MERCGKRCLPAKNSVRNRSRFNALTLQRFNIPKKSSCPGMFYAAK